MSCGAAATGVIRGAFKGLNAKHLLKVRDGIDRCSATNEPELSCAVSQQGTKVIRSDKNAALLHQCHHLIWGGGGIKQTRYTRVNRYLMAEVIQRIQQW